MPAFRALQLDVEGLRHTLHGPSPRWVSCAIPAVEG